MHGDMITHAQLDRLEGKQCFRRQVRAIRPNDGSRYRIDGHSGKLRWFMKRFEHRTMQQRQDIHYLAYTIIKRDLQQVATKPMNFVDVQHDIQLLQGINLYQRFTPLSTIPILG
jgi:hypothetical protein